MKKQLLKEIIEKKEKKIEFAIINDLQNGVRKTEDDIKHNGNYFSWPEKEDVKKFIRSKKKYVELRDFLSLLFYNPKKI